jgi:rhamnose transport system permease protein
MKKFFKRFNPEQIREVFLVAMIFLVVFFFSSLIPNYFNAIFINRLSTSVAIIGVLAVAQTIVYLTKNVDLSLGSIVGVSAYLMGQQLWWHPEIHPLMAVAIAIGIGMILGAINGVLVAFGRVPAIITTIGTLAIFRSFLVVYSNSDPLTTNELPNWIVNLNQISLFDYEGFKLRILFVIMLVVIIIFHLLLKYHRFGRRLYAIGSNPSAARVAGFPDRRIVFTTFLLSGALGGLAGFMYLSRFGNIMVLAGTGLEFAAIAAVVVGGVSSSGGSGTIFGASLGAVLINLLQNSLYRTAAVSEFWRDAILGMLILLAVAVDYLVVGRLRKIWVRAGFQTHSDGSQQKKEDTSHDE